MTPRRKADETYEVSSSHILDSFLGGTSDEEKEGVHSLPLDSIHPHQGQPRRYFDAEKLNQLAASIRDVGILQPLVVRRLDGEHYQLVAGERRYRAALMAGLAEVPVIIRELSDQKAQEIALMENLAREDLNPIEETEGILELIGAKLDCSRDEVMGLLQVGGHRERDSGKEMAVSPQWQVIEEIFAKIGRFTPESFRVNRLPLLNLPEDILQSVRAGEVAYSKARLIARVKDEKQRQKLLLAVVSEGLSRSEISGRIKELRRKRSKKDGGSGELIERLGSIYKQAKKAKSSVDLEKEDRIKALLNELEELLEE